MTEVHRQTFRSDIQGMRAIAVLLVLLYHAHLPGISGGFVGVDVFYVISGFLITNHLATSLEQNGRLSFADFYAKRARRILPASIAVLVLSVIALLIWLPPLQWRSNLQDAAATALYAPNVLFAAKNTDYLADTTPSVFQHYWSLGIEEQFYLLWPALLGIVFVLTRRSRRALIIALVVVVGVSFLLCVALTSRNQPYAFFLLPTRAWELGVGGLLAFVLPLAKRGPGRALASVLGVLGIGFLAGAALLFDDATLFPGVAAALPVAGAALLIYSGHYHSSVVTSALSRAPMMFLGKISYSLYLVHWPVLVIAEQAGGTGRSLPLPVTLGLALLSIPLAYLLFRFVERPFVSRSAPRRSGSRRTLLVAGATAVVLAAVTAGGASAVRYWPMHSSQEAEAAPASLPPAFTAYVPSNVDPALADAYDDNAEIYADGCHAGFAETDPVGCVYGDESAATEVVLFGDSHAAQWFPALAELAEDEGFRLVVHTKSSCPSVDIEKVRNGSPYGACAEWRSNVIDGLQADAPDVVVIANYPGSDDIRPRGDLATAWARGVRSTVDELADASEVFVLADTPSFPSVPATCLSAHVDDVSPCVRTRTDALLTDVASEEDAATRAGGGRYLDLTDYFCTETCAPIIGSRLVYRDSNHITASMSRDLAPVIGRAISD